MIVFYQLLAGQLALNVGLVYVKNGMTIAQANRWLVRAKQFERMQSRAGWYHGYAVYLNGDNQTAVEGWKTNPEALERLTWLGKAATRQKNYERALQWYNVALQISPDYAEGWGLKGDTLMALQQLDSAIDAYETALQLASTPSHQIALARALIAAQTDLQRAEQLLTQASLSAPPSEELYRTLAELAEARGDTPQALGWWEKAAEVEQASVDTLLKLGEMYEQSGVPEKAVRVYLRAVERAPTSSSVRLGLAQAYLTTRQWEAALQEANQLLAQFPDNFEAWFIAGKAYLGLGQHENALNALTQAAIINPAHAEVQALLTQLNSSAPK
ncbi:MAG: hypothetical protein Fur0022_44690 [Anaerolineales bacterium]